MLRTVANNMDRNVITKTINTVKFPGIVHVIKEVMLIMSEIGRFIVYYCHPWPEIT